MILDEKLTGFSRETFLTGDDPMGMVELDMQYESQPGSHWQRRVAPCLRPGSKRAEWASEWRAESENDGRNRFNAVV